MAELLTGVAIGVSLCSMFASWLLAKQSKAFEGQFERLFKIAGDAKERAADADTGRRSEMARAVMLDEALKKRIKEFEELTEQKSALEKALNIATEGLVSTEDNYKRLQEAHAMEIAKLEERMRKMQDRVGRLQICIDAFAETCAYQGVDLERETEARIGDV